MANSRASDAKAGAVARSSASALFARIAWVTLTVVATTSVPAMALVVRNAVLFRMISRRVR